MMKKQVYLYHAHEWSWDDVDSARNAKYDADCVYLTDSPEYAEEFGRHIDLCLVTIENPYVLSEFGGFIFNDGKPFRIEDEDEIAGIGDVCDYEEIYTTLVHRGYDSVLSEPDDFYIVAVLDPSKIEIIQKEVRK